MKIHIQASPSESSSRIFTVSGEDLGFTLEEWNNLPIDQRQAALQKYLDELPEQPYWALDHYQWEHEL
jgi:hypothetical protein